MRLLDYSANVYSQNGEDGILLKILELIPSKDSGVWSSVHGMDNTEQYLQPHRGSRLRCCVDLLL